MLTGGFRTVTTMEKVLTANELDVIGLARPFTLYPDLTNQIFEGDLNYLDVPSPKIGLKLIDKSGFVDIKWHELHIQRLGKGKKPKPELSALAIVPENIGTLAKNLIFGK